MPSKPDSDSIPAIVLAAGASTRLGQPKQLLRLSAFGHETLLDRAIALARDSGAAPIFVILGAHAEQIILECDLLECILIRNQDWAEGMGSSLRVGVAAVLENVPTASAAMVLVCDQPGLSAEHLHRLLDTHEADAMCIVASRYAGRAGVPAIFPRDLFPALLGLEGDQGARLLVQQPGAAVHAIDFPGGEMDLDSPDDVERLNAHPATQPLAETN